MKIDGHYDKSADIAWLRFEGYDPKRVIVPTRSSSGFGNSTPTSGSVVGLEYWWARKVLPSELLRMLPAPPLGVAR